MNPENAGSLLAQPTTQAAREQADYWKKRATVYVMGIVHIKMMHFHNLPQFLSLFSPELTISQDQTNISIKSKITALSVRPRPLHRSARTNFASAELKNLIKCVKTFIKNVVIDNFIKWTTPILSNRKGQKESKPLIIYRRNHHFTFNNIFLYSSSLSQNYIFLFQNITQATIYINQLLVTSASIICDLQCYLVASFPRLTVSCCIRL